MMVAFFGERGDRQLDLAHFAAFVAALHAELVRLEFAHYAQGKVRRGFLFWLHTPCPHWACDGTRPSWVQQTAQHSQRMLLESEKRACMGLIAEQSARTAVKGDVSMLGLMHSAACAGMRAKVRLQAGMGHARPVLVGRALGPAIVWMDVAAQEAISGASFAHSLVAHVRLGRLDRSLDRVDALPQRLRQCQVGQAGCCSALYQVLTLTLRLLCSIVATALGCAACMQAVRCTHGVIILVLYGARLRIGHEAQRQMCMRQVSAEDFQQLARLRQVLHKLEVALDFFNSITNSITKADFQRAVTVVMGQSLAEHVVSGGCFPRHACHSHFSVHDHWGLQELSGKCDRGWQHGS